MHQKIIKYFRILVLALFVIISLPASAKGEPKFYVKQVVYDMGVIKRSSPVKSITIPFKNKGKGKLVIVKTKTSCGCTTVDYPKDFIASGKSSQLVVTFDASGLIPMKTEEKVTIFTNSKNSPLVLTIKAKIEY